ncbi:MAG: hypothetical protein QM658_13380, partial [Gordonia sp. (in: high G+C Gram-positive bacteria)]
RELWRARSSATDLPGVARSAVVTADGDTVTGRDLNTGKQIWRYSRDLPLCAAVVAWPGGENDVLTAYRNSRGCGEIMALDADTGLRKAARTNDADGDVRLTYDANWALSTGSTRLETWGANLVRGVEYGRVDAPVNPDVQPGRSDCRIYSAISGSDRVAIVERCARDAGYRLTVISSSQTSDEKVKQWGSQIITENGQGPAPRVIATSDSVVTVYDNGAIRTFSPEISQLTSQTVSGDPEAPPASQPANSQFFVTFWTGQATVVIDATTGRPVFQVPDAIGAGAVMMGQLILPVPSGISVRDPSTGREVRHIAFDRGPNVRGPVSLSMLGNRFIEQRGDEVVVLGA